MIICVLVLVTLSHFASGVLPPSFTFESPRKVYAIVGEPTRLACVATGDPVPLLTWYKDERELFPDQYVQLDYSPGSSNLTLPTGSILDQGFYQCIAENPIGKALSTVTHVQLTVLGQFPQADPSILRVNEGESISLRCDTPKSVPEAVITWHLRRRGDDNTQAVTLTSRVQQDQDGNLLFSNAVTSDEQGDRHYECHAYNTRMLQSNGGSLYQVIVQRNNDLIQRRPSKMYSTSTPVIGLVGKDVKLQCVFSGFPTPVVHWKRGGGKKLASGRYSMTSHRTVLTLHSLTLNDAGPYICYGRNGMGGSVDTAIELQVYEAPVFTAGLENVNVTAGTEAELHCHARGTPPPIIKWFINGDPIEVFPPPPRMLFVNSESTMLVRRVCSQCEVNEGTNERATDVMVVQCNASNAYGYVYGQGYLNVINATEIISELPESYTLALDEDEAVFECEAITDANTVLTLQWYKGADTILSLGDDRLVVEPDNSLYIDLRELTLEEKAHYRDTYKCVANNGYSSDEAAVYMDIEGAPLPVPVTSAGFDWWWILVVIGILLLILIIILCCCICVKQNKGDEYDVDGLEKKNGIFPEKENRENDFKEYQRPEAHPMRASRASLTSTVELDSDDDGMVDEYDDPDAGKFTEEGAFIGQYDTNKRMPKQSFV